MRIVTILAAATLLSVSVTARQAPPITTAGQPAQLDIRSAGPHSLRVTLKPVSFTGELPGHAGGGRSVVAARRPSACGRSAARVERAVGRFRVAVEPSPLRVTVRDAGGRVIQTLRFEPDGPLTFDVGDGPVLGMGEGGPRPARGTTVARAAGAVRSARRARHDGTAMAGRHVRIAQSGGGAVRDVGLGPVRGDTVGAGRSHGREPREVSAGRSHRPPVRRPSGTSSRTPAKACRRRINTSLVSTTCSSSTPREPTDALADFAAITGTRGDAAAMGARLHAVASHARRRNADAAHHRHVSREADSARRRDLSRHRIRARRMEHASAVVRLQPQRVQARSESRAGRHARTTRQGRRPHGPVGSRSPADAARHDSRRAGRNRGRLAHPVVLAAARRPRARPASMRSGRTKATGSISSSASSVISSITRARCSTTPNVRPWSLQRNGFPGIAQWGGWVWSGDTDTSWKTLEAQIAVGLNYSLSIGPYWGSDIGGFYPNREYTGELYARWFQFAAFCGSFRAHGRVWWMRLPWGWGGRELGPLEYGNNNQAPPPGDARNIDPAELGNPAIEPIAKRYAELRYQLHAVHLHARARSPRPRSSAHARDVAALPDRRDRAREGRSVPLGPRPPDRARLHQGRDHPLRLSAGRRLVRLVDQGARGRRPHASNAPSISRRCRSTRARAPSSRSIRSGSTRTSRSPGRRRFTSSRAPTARSRCTTTTGSVRRISAGRGNWIRMTWNDATRTLTLDPGAPAGATDVVRPRAFRVVLPDGTAKDVSYTGRRVTVVF